MTQNTIQITDYKTAINKIEDNLGESLNSSNTAVVQTRVPQFKVNIADAKDFIKIATEYLGVKSINPEDVKVITMDSLNKENISKIKMR